MTKMIIQPLIVSIGIILQCFLLISISKGTAQGKTPGFSLLSKPYILESGIFNGAKAATVADVEKKAERMFAMVIQTEKTPWLRVHFADYHLGNGSYIILTSLHDSQSQFLDSTYMPIWSNTSAIFNGNEVELTLYVAPGDRGIFVNVDEIRVADPADFGYGKNDPEPLSEGYIRSICGDLDDRIPSNDSRVGRLFFGGCTGWLVHNGTALTAGHCGVQTGHIMEFNVPLSTANGVPNPALIIDQYPVTGVVAEQDNGEGEDFSIYTLGPNANTGQRAHIAQGFFHMTGLVPSIGSTVRVTGYGYDPFPSGTGGPGAECCDWDSDGNCNFTCNSASFTQQTDIGDCDDCKVGTAIEHEVDTLPANSGSPIIWESNGMAIGIHTQGGCDSFWSDYDNAGTWLGYDRLANSLHGFLGPNTVYVDSMSITPVSAGGVLHPFKTVTGAVSYIPDGWQIAIVAGSYPASDGNTFIAGSDGKSMTLIAPVGTVTIGN